MCKWTRLGFTRRCEVGMKHAMSDGGMVTESLLFQGSSYLSCLRDKSFRCGFDGTICARNLFIPFSAARPHFDSSLARLVFTATHGSSAKIIGLSYIPGSTIERLSHKTGFTISTVHQSYNTQSNNQSVRTSGSGLVISHLFLLFRYAPALLYCRYLPYFPARLIISSEIPAESRGIQIIGAGSLVFKN